MKTSVALLTLSLCYLSVAEVHAALKTIDSNPSNPSADGGSQCNGILRQLEAKMRDTEQQLKDLRQKIQGNQVAFGASLGYHGGVGPFNTEITLKFNNVFINSGSYNPATGIFTAPVKGVYYFRFSGQNWSSKAMGLRLMKNGQQVVTVHNYVSGSRYEAATNGMTLQLEVGDHVYMTLSPHTWIHDNSGNYCTFAGHLLYAL